MKITSHHFTYLEGYCEPQPIDVVQQRPEEVSFEILFQDKTSTAVEIFLFYTEISVRSETISRNLHQFALFQEWRNIPSLCYESWGTADCWGEIKTPGEREESEASFLQTNNGTNSMGSTVFNTSFAVYDYQGDFCYLIPILTGKKLPCAVLMC